MSREVNFFSQMIKYLKERNKGISGAFGIGDKELIKLQKFIHTAKDAYDELSELAKLEIEETLKDIEFDKNSNEKNDTENNQNYDEKSIKSSMDFKDSTGTEQSDAIEKSDTINNIIDILDEDDSNEELILREFTYMHEESGDDFYVDLFKVLANLEFSPEEALTNWHVILKHRENLKNKLGRNAGFRVAMLDYFINQNKRLKNPKLIELNFYEKAVKYALVDELTGLYNRKFFDKTIHSEMNKSRRHNNTFSLVFIEIEDFQQYINENGEKAGDKLLIRFASAAKNACRQEDTLCRMGKDEFAILLPQTSANGAVIVTERIREILKKKNAYLNFSAGISNFPEDGNEVELLIKKADRAMYSSKSQGKNTTTIYSSDKRKYKRMKVNWDINFALVDEEGKMFKKERSRLEDISVEGLCFFTEKQMKINDKVLFNLEIPNHENKETIVGVVKWISKIGEMRYKVGVNFASHTDGENIRNIFSV